MNDTITIIIKDRGFEIDAPEEQENLAALLHDFLTAHTSPYKEQFELVADLIDRECYEQAATRLHKIAREIGDISEVVHYKTLLAMEVGQ